MASNPIQTTKQVNLLNSINMNTVLVSYSPIIITLCINHIFRNIFNIYIYSCTSFKLCKWWICCWKFLLCYNKCYNHNVYY